MAPLWKRPGFWIFFIFLVCIVTRLFFAFQTDEFTSPEAYAIVRQVESIRSSGLPLFTDPLLTESRFTLFLPGYYYLLALFTFLLPEVIALKVISNVLGASIVICAYLLSREITKDKTANVLVALLAGFNPLFFQSTVNSLSIHNLVTPLFFLVAYLFLRVAAVKEKANPYLLLFTFLIFTSPYALVFLLGAGFFFLLQKVERQKVKPAHVELLLFSLVLFFWSLLIVYKRPFQDLGIAVIWQNIPSALVGDFFRQLDVVVAVSLIGILPLFAGSYALYRSLFENPRAGMLLMTGILIGITLLLLLRLLKGNIGLIYFGLIFAVFFGEFVKIARGWFEDTKLSRYRIYLLLTLIILSVFSSFIPAVVYAAADVDQTPAQGELDTYRWLKANTKEDAIILVPLRFADILQVKADRSVILSSNFLGVSSTDERYEDIAAIYTSFYKTSAIALLNKYDVDYLLWSERIGQEFNRTELAFIDERCFKKVYDDEMQVYQVRCRISESDA